MTAGKPWMKFYPSDWRADQTLRVVSIGARGLWIECMCIMHEADPYGHLLINGRPVTEAQLAALTGTPVDQVATLLTELEDAGVFSRNGKGVIYSRRMTRDEKKSRNARKNGKSGGNPSLSKQRENQPPDNPPDKPRDKGEVKTQRPEARGQRPEAASAASRAQPVGRKFLEALGVDWASHEVNGGHYGEVRGWLVAGYTEGEILAVAARRQDAASKRNPIAYIARFMPEEIERQRQARRVEDGPPIDREGALWRARLTAWRSKGIWESSWGPKPGQPGCEAPAALVREFEMEETGS